MRALGWMVFVVFASLAVARAEDWSEFTRNDIQSRGYIDRSALEEDEPSVFERMGQSTRSFFGRMRRTLSFGESTPKPKPVSHKKKPTKGIFGSLFAPAESESTETMKDFLESERPGI